MYFPKNLSSCHFSRFFSIFNCNSFSLLGPCLWALFIPAPLVTSDNSGSNRCLGVALKPLMGSLATLSTHFSLFPLLKDILQDALQVLISLLPFFGSLELTTSLFLWSFALSFAFTLGPSPFGLPLVSALAFLLFALLILTSYHLVTLGI